MNRRALIALPALALLPAPLRAASFAMSWQRDVGELRAAMPGDAAGQWSRRLGVPLRPVTLGDAALVRAVHRGQVEFGQCPTARVQAGLRDRLGDRLLWPRRDRFVLASLPRPMRDDIATLLQAA